MHQWISILAYMPPLEKPILITWIGDGEEHRIRKARARIDGTYYDPEDGKDWKTPTHWMLDPTEFYS